MNQPVSLTSSSLPAAPAAALPVAWIAASWHADVVARAYEGFTAEWARLPAQGAAPAPVQEVAPAADAEDESRYLRPLAEQVAELERRAIAAAMKAHGGNKLATARQLGISRATLYGRLENPD